MKTLKIIIALLFLCCINNNSFAQTPDPGLPGIYAVSKGEYNLGDLVYMPPSLSSYIEVRGSVHYPTDLSKGPYPVLVFLHGRHYTCYNTATNAANGSWPCGSGYQSIVSYEGYDYLANTMASHGYIVISISCNAINAIDAGLSDFGMQARAELLQHHLDLWKTFNTVGAAPFDTLFKGKLDMQNIGTMGHSRGGEGVVFNAQYNKSLGSPYGIKAVLTLAPVDFERHILHDIPFMNVAPYCDGDVYDLQGVHYYDDARYTDTADEAAKHSVLFMGANHNYFNTVWTPGSYVAGGSDDWYSSSDAQCSALSPTRFDSTKQKAAFNAYAAAFFRSYIGHETSFLPILEVKDIVPPVSSTLDSSNVFVSYHPGRSRRLDINRTDSLVRISTNTLKGIVTETGLVSSEICGGGFSMPSCSVGIAQPHASNGGPVGLGQMGMRWNDTTEWYQNQIPQAYENLSYFQSLIFRAAENHLETVTGTNLDFTVQLIDSAGNTSNQVISNNSHALFYEPGTSSAKTLFNTINIPLSKFSGVDMTKVKYVKFVFNKSAAGSVLISDLAFLTSPCGMFNATFSYSLGSSYKVNFTNNTLSNSGDSLAWKWRFGDHFSGANDSSSLQNPLHKYSGAGTYNTCLYVTSYRKSGFVCTDTFCTTIVLVPNYVPTPAAEQITIVPNPAKDHLHITGTTNTDVLTLIDLYGRQVFTTTISSPDIYLPQSLVAGVYYAVITTDGEKVYKKLVINK